jgi:superfamily I DNA/RNA helicase
MKLSKYQSEIEGVYLNTNKNIFINASAGAAKTTTIVRLANQTVPTKKVCFLAFNKSIAEELRLKLPKHIDVSTTHAKAYGILKSNIKMNVKINELKNFIYCKQVIKRKFKDRKRESAHFFVVSDIINYMKLNNLQPTEENVSTVCDSYGLAANEDHIIDTIKVMLFIVEDEKSLAKPKSHNIDFTDMLYLCVNKVKKEDFPKYDVVILDESQDFNICQQILALNLLKPKGRLISVGDEKQAINHFAGSSLDTFNSFKDRPNTVSLQLPISYRLPLSGVDFANRVFPNSTEAKENAIEGEIKDGCISEAEDKDLVICRNNKPLVLAWMELTRTKKKSYIQGKEFGENLKHIIDKIDTINELTDLLETKYKDLKSKGVNDPLFNSQYQSLKEKCDIIEILFEEIGSLSKIYDTLDEIFSNNGVGIKLTTIHKSKGLEADNVFILNWDLLPSKFARSEGEFYAEKCLQYVAVTRHKNKLIFINIER